MRKNIAIAFIMTAICTLSNAQATPASTPLKGATCWANIGQSATLSNIAELSCGVIGKVTVTQIYEKGFRIVAVVHNPKYPELLTVVIEEQR